MTLVEFAKDLLSRVPGKAVYREISHQRHPATEQLRLLLEKLHVLQEPGAIEAVLVAGMGPREALPAAAVNTLKPGSKSLFLCSVFPMPS